MRIAVEHLKEVMMGWLAGKLAAIGIRRFVNNRYGRYGTMTQLRIDNANKKIDLELLLEGEKEPIAVHVANYELDAGGELRLTDISVSRAWMNLLAQELVANKPLPIPASMVKWLRMVL